MRIEDDIKLDFSDVLIKPKRSELKSRKDAILERKFTFKHSEKVFKGIPIVASNMDHTGTYEMDDVLDRYDMLTVICKHNKWHLTWASAPSYKKIRCMGLDEDLEEIERDDSPFVCLDVANGYTERFCAYVSEMRKSMAFWDKIIIAGNVCTAEATEQIILAGADIVKIGIGPGSVCTTRKMTGVGYPQLSCIIECADAAHGLGGHVMSDGGCVDVGDIAKAFGAGADFVMLGGMLAGHDECKGEIVGAGGPDNSPGTMKFYGMSSEEAQLEYGGVKKYRASEGKLVHVPYKGPVKNTIEQILGGLRSACTYAGSNSLKSLPKCTTFVRVNRQLNTSFNRYENI